MCRVFAHSARLKPAGGPVAARPWEVNCINERPFVLLSRPARRREVVHPYCLPGPVDAGPGADPAFAVEAPRPGYLVAILGVGPAAHYRPGDEALHVREAPAWRIYPRGV